MGHSKAAGPTPGQWRLEMLQHLVAAGDYLLMLTWTKPERGGGEGGRRREGSPAPEP